MFHISRILLASVAVSLSMNASTIAQSGDAAAGKQKSANCVACHGVDGNNPSDQFPKLAGQVPGYIANQLALFKSQERKDPVMVAMVAALNEQDMRDLDAFYSSQDIEPVAIPADRAEDALAGKAIYRSGLAEYSVPACMGCHGPAGAGIPPQYPSLGGQHAAYIESALLAFKSGERENAIMQSIAFPLSKKQVRQLALYLSALH